MSITRTDILAAATCLEGHVFRTPCIPAEAISRTVGATVFLKLENLQHTASFKVRGALVKLLRLSADERTAGVVAASAGNHAQGVAYHASRLGIPATIVMPVGTPFTKIGRTEALGAKVVVAGDDLNAAEARARDIADGCGATFVHPYDDPDIIAGQGTVGLEVLADVPEIDTLVAPIGGGGLMAGIATAVRAVRPSIRLVGVEAGQYPSMHRAIGGRCDEGAAGPTLAEGIAVKRPGHLTRPIIEAEVDDIMLVDEAALEQAVHMFMVQQHLVVEGAGAAPLAAMLTNPSQFAGRQVGLIVSGGNIDSRLLAAILTRGLAREGRLVRMRIEIDDAPGVLARVCGLIGDSGGNIVEVHHRRLFQDVPIKRADVDVVVETQDTRHARGLIDCIANAGYAVRQLSGVAEEDWG